MEVAMETELARQITIPPNVQQGLLLLLRAHSYAQDVSQDVWDFAVEIANLQSVGLTSSEFRWLVCKGYIEHASEITVRGQMSRHFERDGGLTFAPQSCFVLTPAGVAFAQCVADRGAANDEPELSGPTQRPVWDASRRQLRVGELLVKHFRVPSPNQETVLATFEEEHWPEQVDDPLPPAAELDAKRRLHDTIKSLNRNQRSRLVRFMGDGTGEGVRWELCQIGPLSPSKGRPETTSPPSPRPVGGRAAFKLGVTKD